jgi:hypothetical protein
LTEPTNPLQATAGKLGAILSTSCEVFLDDDMTGQTGVGRARKKRRASSSSGLSGEPIADLIEASGHGTAAKAGYIHAADLMIMSDDQRIPLQSGMTNAP